MCKRHKKKRSIIYKKVILFIIYDVYKKNIIKKIIYDTRG